MKALTVWQPWASLIAIGAKPYEFRKRKPPSNMIGQRIAIHAGARRIKSIEVMSLLLRLETGFTSDLPPPCLRVDKALPFLRKVKSAIFNVGGLFAEDAHLPPLSAIVCTAISENQKVATNVRANSAGQTTAIETIISTGDGRCSTFSRLYLQSSTAAPKVCGTGGRPHDLPTKWTCLYP